MVVSHRLMDAVLLATVLHKPLDFLHFSVSSKETLIITISTFAGVLRSGADLLVWGHLWHQQPCDRKRNHRDRELQTCCSSEISAVILLLPPAMMNSKVWPPPCILVGTSKIGISATEWSSVICKVEEQSRSWICIYVMVQHMESPLMTSVCAVGGRTSFYIMELCSLGEFPLILTCEMRWVQIMGHFFWLRKYSLRLLGNSRSPALSPSNPN